MRLLLISNSTQHGTGYLDHCADAIASFLGRAVTRVVFVPYAIFDRNAYAAKARARFEAMGYHLDSVHDFAGGPVRAVEGADALFIGGGNTFRLLDALWREAGLTEVSSRAIDVPTTFPDFDDYWRPFLGGQAPAPGYAMSLDEGRRTALRERIRSILPIAEDGSINLMARAWAVRGRAE